MKEYIVQAYKQETIDSFDAHDAPELVRCKNCDNKECWGLAGNVVCGIDGTPHRPDWFCADGERKEGYVSVPFSWLVKFCTHIDFVEPLTDAEREVAWRQKLRQQFGINVSKKAVK